MISTGYTDLQLAQHFQNKFKAIPDKKWITGQFRDARGNCCARGHCGGTGINSTKEEGYLVDLFVKYVNNLPERVNDGQIYLGRGDTPKDRILAALDDIEQKLTKPNQ